MSNWKAALAAFVFAQLLAGCAMTHGPGAQFALYCPVGFTLGYDRMCYRPWPTPPPANYGTYFAPASPPPAHNWGRDLAMAGAGAAAAIGGTKLLERGAAGEVATAGESAAARVGAGAAARGAVVGAELLGGEMAGAAEAEVVIEEILAILCL